MFVAGQFTLIISHVRAMRWPPTSDAHLHQPTCIKQQKAHPSSPACSRTYRRSPALEALTPRNNSPPIFLSTPNKPYFNRGPVQKRGHTHCRILSWRNTCVNDLVIVIVLVFVVVLVKVIEHGDGVCDRDCAGDRAGVL